MLLPPLSGIVPERDEDCADADLFFFVIGACPECTRFSGLTVIGNRGALAVRARVETEDASLDIEVPAFGLSEPTMIDLGSPATPVSVRALGARDCDDSDNVIDLELGRVECYVP